MDGRWVLLTLVVAVAAAIRLRRRSTYGSTAQIPKSAGRTAVDDSALTRKSSPPPPADGRVGRSSPPEDAFEKQPPTDPVDRVEPADLEPMSPGPDEAAFDVDSVGAALERVWAEHAHDADTILDARLRQLLDRRVPVRGLRRAPGGRAIRVAFADGTVLLCRGSGQGDFGRLGLALHRQSVRLAAFTHVEDVTRLEFAWNPDHRLAALAVGLDQPD